MSEKILENIWYNPSHPASYSTASTLWKAVKKSIPLSTIKHWLTKQTAYTLHRPVKRRFPRNFYFVHNIDDQWQADLNDMQSLRNHNKGYRYILTVIDIFSRHAWAVPVKNKTGVCIKKAFHQIFKQSKRKPLQLQTDKGREFTNSIVQEYLKKQNVIYFTTKNPDIKASIVERFNRTLKERMWKYFTKQRTSCYVNVLPKLLKAYNHKIHSSIKMAPADVTPEKVLKVWHNMYDKKLKSDSSPLLSLKMPFKIGDTVRITKTKKRFDKGYMENWTREIFVVERILKRNPQVYELKDLQGHKIDGTFYTEELQLVRLPDMHEIDKILATKGKEASKKLLVHWKGYSRLFDSWISASFLESKKERERHKFL